MDIIAKVAEVVSRAFPELEKRVMAVSEAQVNKERIPRLPACLVALRYEAPDSKAHTLNTANQITIFEYFLVDFWLEPVVFDDNGKRIDPKTIDGAARQTVYYAFYPYDEIRDRLLDAIAEIDGSEFGLISYEKLEVAADNFAVTLTFSFRCKWQWCRTLPGQQQTNPGKIIFKGFSPEVQHGDGKS